MVDLNHIFLFLALVSPLAVLARSWRAHPGQESWRIAAALVLGVTGFAWMVMRQQAGYIGAGAWFALLFLPALGLKRMTELAAQRRYKLARRLASVLHWLHPSGDLREQIRTLRLLERRQRAGDLPPSIRKEDLRLHRQRRGLRNAPTVIVLIIVNLLVFGMELLATSHGPDDPEVLLRLGAVQPELVLIDHQYWRLVAALFLHAGPVHLLFNLFALYVLGPPFERAIGSLRFLACYLVAGICSTAGVVILWRLGLVHNEEVVGASGSVMGIVGAWAAFLIRDRHTPEVRRRLMNLIMIVVIQTVFDLTTPQVSKSAHLCGVAGGFLIGLLLSPKGAHRIRENPRAWSG